MGEPCKCLAEVDEKLAETGHFLAATMLSAAFGSVDKPIMTIMRKDRWVAETRRGKVGTMIPSFCPFCGIKYPEDARPPRATVPQAGEPSNG